MWNRGKVVISGIVALAVVAALFSTWYHYQHTHRSRDFWGPSMALLIAEAAEVEVLQLAAVPAGSSADEPNSTTTHTVSPIQFGGRSWNVVAAREALKAPGMTNVRRALVIDTTFEWNEPGPEAVPNWQFALEFTNEQHWATVLFDFDTHQVALSGGKRTALLDPAANQDIREFFAEQFAADKVEQTKNPGN